LVFLFSLFCWIGSVTIAFIPSFLRLCFWFIALSRKSPEFFLTRLFRCHFPPVPLPFSDSSRESSFMLTAQSGPLLPTFRKDRAGSQPPGNSRVFCPSLSANKERGLFRSNSASRERTLSQEVPGVFFSNNRLMFRVNLVRASAPTKRSPLFRQKPPWERFGSFPTPHQLRSQNLLKRLLSRKVVRVSVSAFLLERCSSLPPGSSSSGSLVQTFFLLSVQRLLVLFVSFVLRVQQCLGVASGGLGLDALSLRPSPPHFQPPGAAQVGGQEVLNAISTPSSLPIPPFLTWFEQQRPGWSGGFPPHSLC